MISGPKDPSGGARRTPTHNAGDKLGYIADIVQELRRMADGAGYRTLSAILAAAQVEARQQRDDTDR